MTYKPVICELKRISRDIQKGLSEEDAIAIVFVFAVAVIWVLNMPIIISLITILLGILFIIYEGCAEKRKVEAEKVILLKSREGIKMSEKSEPNSARIQQIANEENISVMILESQQNKEFAMVRVRGIHKGQSVDDVVWVDFDTELKLLMMEFIRKNEGVLDHFDGLNPVFKEGAKIKNFDGSFTDAKYALVHAMLTLRKFAVRSAGTKAAKRVQMKLMNKEFREKEEIADEQAEQDLVNSKKRKQ